MSALGHLKPLMRKARLDLQDDPCGQIAYERNQLPVGFREFRWECKEYSKILKNTSITSMHDKDGLDF
jgi:hypothetical protein